jgi:uncharacterized protein (UPF0262 family)
MSDPRIIAITLDGDTWPAHAADADRERQIAILDLLAGNHFAPRKPIGAGYDGPYRVGLAVEESRLAIDIADEDGQALHTIKLGLARFRRPLKDYRAICDSLAQAQAGGQPAQIETVDMARRAIHNGAAQLLRECLEGKVDMDFDTARRLFTLLTALHIRG